MGVVEFCQFFLVTFRPNIVPVIGDKTPLQISVTQLIPLVLLSNLIDSDKPGR